MSAPNRLSAIVLLCVPLLGGWDWFRSNDGDVARGNAHYQRGAFDQALRAYEAAVGSGGESARIHFNIGTALYQLGKTAENQARRDRFIGQAEAEFRLATDTRDNRLRSSAHYNLGNALFVRQRYREAAIAYRKALRANPNNDDARYNLELALRRMVSPEPPPPGQRGGGADNGSQPQPPPGDNGAPGEGTGTPPPGDGDGAGKPEGGASGPDAGAQRPHGSAEPGPPDAGAGAGGESPPEGSAAPSPADAKPAPDSPPPGTSKRPADQRTGKDPGAESGRGTTSPSDADGRKSESRRKLRALRRRSRELRKQRFRQGQHSRGEARVNPGKAW